MIKFDIDLFQNRNFLPIFRLMRSVPVLTPVLPTVQKEHWSPSLQTMSEFKANTFFKAKNFKNDTEIQAYRKITQYNEKEEMFYLKSEPKTESQYKGWHLTNPEVVRFIEFEHSINKNHKERLKTENF